MIPITVRRCTKCGDETYEAHPGAFLRREFDTKEKALNYLIEYYTKSIGDYKRECRGKEVARRSLLEAQHALQEMPPIAYA